jgi:hypothetical protein
MNRKTFDLICLKIFNFNKITKPSEKEKVKNKKIKKYFYPSFCPS